MRLHLLLLAVFADAATNEAWEYDSLCAKEGIARHMAAVRGEAVLDDEEVDVAVADCLKIAEIKREEAVLRQAAPPRATIPLAALILSPPSHDAPLVPVPPPAAEGSPTPAPLHFTRTPAPPTAKFVGVLGAAPPPIEFVSRDSHKEHLPVGSRLTNIRPKPEDAPEADEVPDPADTDEPTINAVIENAEPDAEPAADAVMPRAPEATPETREDGGEILASAEDAGVSFMAFVAGLRPAAEATAEEAKVAETEADDTVAEADANQEPRAVEAAQDEEPELTDDKEQETADAANPFGIESRHGLVFAPRNADVPVIPAKPTRTPGVPTAAPVHYTRSAPTPAQSPVDGVPARDRAEPQYDHHIHTVHREDNGPVGDEKPDAEGEVTSELPKEPEAAPETAEATVKSEGKRTNVRWTSVVPSVARAPAGFRMWTTARNSFKPTLGYRPILTTV